MSKTKVILDTDGGTDDAWALATLLKCEEKYNIELKAVTIVTGNTKLNHACQNMLLILKTLNRMDVPVYAGSESCLIRNNFQSVYHGIDGFKDVLSPDEKPSLDLLQKEHAVLQMKHLIDEFPNEIVIFCVGPLTNLSLLYKLYPRISQKIGSLYIMGGNTKGIGNITSAAEFNFYFDPEAAKIVLDESECLQYILPIETCILASQHSPHLEWRFKILNSISSPMVELMDRIEADVQFRKNFIPCDAYLIACFVFPEYMNMKMIEEHVAVECSGSYTRGQMVIDHRKDLKPNTLIIEEFDAEFFKKVLLWVCGHFSDI